MTYATIAKERSKITKEQKQSFIFFKQGLEEESDGVCCKWVQYWRLEPELQLAKELVQEVLSGMTHMDFASHWLLRSSGKVS